MYYVREVGKSLRCCCGKRMIRLNFFYSGAISIWTEDSFTMLFCRKCQKLKRGFWGRLMGTPKATNPKIQSSFKNFIGR